VTWLLGLGCLAYAGATVLTGARLDDFPGIGRLRRRWLQILVLTMLGLAFIAAGFGIRAFDRFTDEQDEPDPPIVVTGDPEDLSPPPTAPSG
jgi:hypothetical protein